MAREYRGGPESLYYFYLPPNDGEEIDTGGETNRRIFQDGDCDGDDRIDPEGGGLGGNGRTTFYPTGARKPTLSEPGERDNFREETDERKAGPRTYWVLDAELIPAPEVWEGRARQTSQRATRPCPPSGLPRRKPSRETAAGSTAAARADRLITSTCITIPLSLIARRNGLARTSTPRPLGPEPCI